MAYVIGFDLGSQSLKGVMLDSNGSVVTEASSAYYISFPHPNWAEQDTNEWIKALKEVISELLRQSGISANEIGTVGFASQVDGVVAVDRWGHALRPALIWMDRRSEEECLQFKETASPEEIFNLTGLNLDSSHVAPKIKWIQQNEPDIYQQTHAFLLPGSYMVHYLTNKHITDYSNASSTMLYDIHLKTWSERMLSITGINIATIGEIGAADDIVGTLTIQAAQLFGLHPSTKVIVGCGDEHGACLGAGLIAPGIVCDIVGTAEPVAVVIDRPIFDQTGLLETHAHADKRWWLLENPGFVSGGCIRWYLDAIAQMSYSEMSIGAELIHPGSEGLIFLPCLNGSMTPKWNGNAKGVFYGLTMKHTKDHLTRAVYEGCAFGFRDIITRFGELGVDCSEIRLVGGGAKSKLWCQIKADVTGKSIRTMKTGEATAIGAAMLAGVAEGTFSCLEEAVDKLVECEGIYEPNPSHKVAYDLAYDLYKTLYSAMEPLFNNKKFS